jgi:hypothetical protein
MGSRSSRVRRRKLRRQANRLKLDSGALLRKLPRQANRLKLDSGALLALGR